jgi:NAD(P)-dependent dehydrogenase (short-subunit alcohol dehydrogenase family)
MVPGQFNFGELFDLSGRVALITGAGAGLGEAIAAGFAEYGCDFAAADLNLAAAKVAMDLPAGEAAVPLPESVPDREFAVSPRARRLAEELGIDLTAVRPGRGRPVTEKDVRRFQARRASQEVNTYEP